MRISNQLHSLTAFPTQLLSWAPAAPVTFFWYWDYNLYQRFSTSSDSAILGTFGNV